jgi:tetratricopeptide (TPR) repeat protein
VNPPLLLRQYQKYLRDPQAWAFMDAVHRHYTKETLGRLLLAGSVATRRAAALALGLLGHAGDASLIGPGLADRDRAVRLLAEHGIQELWMRGRCDAERRELAVIRRLAATHQYLLALNAATDFALSSRSLAEAWYARAQIRFMLHSYRHAFHDACKALARDKYHFPAATLAGQCQLALNNESQAIRNFQRALRICPDLEHVRLHVHRLKGHDENA